MISVEGTKRSPAPTSLIDSVKRAPRDLWIVFSRSRLVIVVCRKAGSEPRVVWQTDESARLRFNHAARDSIEITWPDKCRAAFYPTFEERKLVAEFVRATWSYYEGRRGRPGRRSGLVSVLNAPEAREAEACGRRNVSTCANRCVPKSLATGQKRRMCFIFRRGRWSIAFRDAPRRAISRALDECAGSSGKRAWCCVMSPCFLSASW